MRFPSIKDVAEELTFININVECEDEEGRDVRLQVYENGCWVIRSGDASYDLDHHGYWGASYVPGVMNGAVGKFDSRDVARDLIDQARDSYEQSKDL